MQEYGLKEPSHLGCSGRALLTVVPVLLAVVAMGAGGYLWVKSTMPQVVVVGGFPRALGPSTPIKLRWTNPHGARRVTVVVEQNGVPAVAFAKDWESRRFSFSPQPVGPDEIAISIDKSALPGLAPGKASVIVEVVSNDLRGQVGRVVNELPVVLEKPSVISNEKPAFFRRGGTGAVVFTVAGGWSEAGVRVGTHEFLSWPSKSRAERRVCLFAFPPDVDPETAPVLFAKNAIGDEATAPMPNRMMPATFRDRTLELSDRLMDKVLGELDPGSQGEAAERFARINSTMRRANDARLAELAKQTEGKRLWDGIFLLLPRGKAEAMFADHRTYKYKGKPLNREWHLGIDLASVKNAPIPAGNNGRVVYSGRLGIYGNCVVIDHGLGVATVYAHMSGAAVRAGDWVKRGQEIGKSGMTGLAGGDHLHLGLMIQGVFVNPVEWTHAAWMEQFLQPALAELD